MGLAGGSLVAPDGHFLLFNVARGILDAAVVPPAIGSLPGPFVESALNLRGGRSMCARKHLPLLVVHIGRVRITPLVESGDVTAQPSKNGFELFPG